MNFLNPVPAIQSALYGSGPASIRDALRSSVSHDAAVKFGPPFGQMTGPGEFFGSVYEPLLAALPDVERRDLIVVDGPATAEGQWIGCSGYYIGTFTQPWLGIPATNRPVGMRYHEFFYCVGGQIVEIQAIWDIPEVMMQAGCWPMSPSIGRDWMVPGPASQDGLSHGAREEWQAAKSLETVAEMLKQMGRHPAEPADTMKLDRFWHPKVNWYGPAGIGTARGIDDFRRFHQIPFLRAMPNRRVLDDQVLFADNEYVAATGWPNMKMTITGGGWLGIAPNSQAITVRSLDFWRLEQGLIRENWVLIDILDVYDQIGIDVFQRMNELIS